jgi:hypothetical protein
VLYGRSESPAVLLIDGDSVRLEPADDLWGLTTPTATAALGERYGPGWSFGVIGPAGENRVRFATLSFDTRHAGRGGVGAVLGAKNLKAVGVRGDRRAEVADPARVVKLAKDLSARSFGPATAKYRELGTVANLLTFNRLNALPTRNFQPKFDAFPWRAPDEAALTAWRKGRTGYPVIDAGMRELWATGFMHNRIRMVVASFLIKNMLVDWRTGEDWFWDTLCDADPASNAASWQWVAGSGADAAPYFRIFNPVLQGEKFDPDAAYVRRWVPEIAGLPDKWLHRPGRAPAEELKAAGLRLGRDYPAPILDLAATRDRALAALATIS